MLGDSRLLNNLLKTEKEATKSFGLWCQDSNSANSALNAWAVADSGDTQDLMDTAIRITELLSNCSELQRNYLNSLKTYRNSLKSLLKKEAELRIILKDREILVGRLIKLGNKRPNDSNFDSHNLKLEDAQRELNGCEAYLQEEEAILSKAKRKVFKESLTGRMRAMGDLGKVMDESSLEAIELLSRLGQGFEISGYSREEIGSAAGDSITPSHSASQKTASNYSSEYSSDEEPTASFSPILGIPPPHQIQNNSNSNYYSNHLPEPIPLPRFESPTPRSRATSMGAATPKPSRERTTSVPRSSVIPILPSVPIAARGSRSNLPSMDIPKAPARVNLDMVRRGGGDSSDEEDERAFESMQKSSNLKSGLKESNSKRFLRKKGGSDTSTITELRNVKSQDSFGSKKGGFFGGLARLFKKNKEEESYSGGGRNGSSWETRTEKNVFNSSRNGTTATTGGGNRRGGDSSDEEPKRKLIRVVVNPKDRKAFSEVGRNKINDAGSIKSGKAMSDIGYNTRAITSSSSFVEPTKKIRKKKSISLYELPVPLPVPVAPSVRSTVLSRSNTVTSNFSINTVATNVGSIGTNGLPKKRKKKVVNSINNTMNPSGLRQPLTVADLANSLPSAARSKSFYDLSSPTRLRNESEMPGYGSEEVERKGGKIPSHLKEVEKIVKKENLKYGVEGWINKPGSPSLTRTSSTSRRESTITLKEEKEKLSSLVEEGTSRKYFSNGNLPTATLTLPSPNLNGDSNGISDGNGSSSITKRKSVRMAETSLSPNSHHSPTSSVLSSSHEMGSSSSNTGKGILLNSKAKIGNRDLTVWKSRTENGGEGTHSTTTTSGGTNDYEDSSDEDEGEYSKARKAFQKQTKKFENIENVLAAEKGKGRASNQD